MQDDKNNNLFETVFQGVEPPRDDHEYQKKTDSKPETSQVEPVATSNSTNEIEPQTQQPIQTSSDVLPSEMESQPASVEFEPMAVQPDTVTPITENISKMNTDTDEQKLNPVVRFLVYLLLLAGILFSLYNLVVVPIMNAVSEKNVSDTRQKKVETYLQDVMTSFQNNQQLQNLETCQIVSSGKYCTMDENFLDESRALIIQSEYEVDGGMLFFKDGNIQSGYIYLEGHTYNIQNGKVTEKASVDTTAEES